VRIRRSPLVALLVSLVLLAGLLPAQAAAATAWRFNLYRSAGYLTQNPYSTACVAAATMMMLNFTDLSGGGGNGFRWTSTRVKNSSDPANKRDLTSVLSFARSHDTLAIGRPGSDPHGWRNALNYYGWGLSAMTTPSLRVYEDKAYTSFDTALKSAVIAIARNKMPVGMLGWAGGHAQVIHGYLVVGEDPRVSSNFTVSALYISDPLYADNYVNRLLWYSTLKVGPTRIRFQRYRETDSPYDDPYTPGWKRSSTASTTSEWYLKWVLIVPIRPGMPDVEPTPDPSPTPTPTPPPSPAEGDGAPGSDGGTGTTQNRTAPDPTPSPTSTPAATPTPTPTATATPDPTEPPAPTATPAPTDAPSASPSESSAAASVAAG
jgi:hypothetical protein